MLVGHHAILKAMKYNDWTLDVFGNLEVVKPFFK